MNQEILNLIQGNPQAMQAVGEAIQEIMNDEDVSPEAVDQLAQIIESTLQNPAVYPQTRMAMIQSNLIDEDDLPEQFDEMLLTVLLIALKVVQSQLQSGNMPRFARGGLNQIARMGRYGDTMLAHITPEEARLLRARGGSGTINPQTGLPEFWSLKKAFKKIVKAVAPVLPIVLSVVAPGVGTAIGSALSGGALAGTAASMLGSAAIGGLSSAATGGNALQGAIGGALGAGAGGALGGMVGDATGMALSDTAKNVIGSSLIGGAQSAATGGDFLTGAVQGGVGGYAGSTLSGAAGGVGGKLGTGLQTAGQQFGNALTMGATPTQAFTAGALSGLAAGLTAPAPKSPYDLTPSDSGGLGLKAPSDIAIEGLKTPALNTASIPEMGVGMDYSLTGGRTPTFKGPETMAVDYSLTAPTAQTASAQPELGTGIQQSPLNAIAAQTAATTPGVKGTVGDAAANKGFSLGTAANMLPLLSLFSAAETPEQVQQVVAGMTPEQQEYFNRPMRTWNWDTLNAAAKIQGLPIGSYIARNWDKVGGGMYDNPAAQEPQQLARGGALMRLARGGGSGRDDTIPARLSDGEYVMDAETVALLGDGSTGEGARRLDQMRAKIRQHKGKSMARGKFSANAKSPLAYLKGA
ncbi:MAG: hypothetical protein RL758_214 [Pseudomonadota bacterium]|jgi:hypothetical protein